MQTGILTKILKQMLLVGGLQFGPYSSWVLGMTNTETHPLSLKSLEEQGRDIQRKYIFRFKIILFDYPWKRSITGGSGSTHFWDNDD